MRARVLVALLTLVLACSALPAAAAPILSIAPIPSVSVGDTFTVNVDITDVTDLYGYQFDLSFDTNYLQVVPQIVNGSPQDVVEGPFLATGGATFFIPGVHNGAGTIEFTIDLLLGSVSGVTGSGTLASITFLALAATGINPTALTLSNYLLLDSTLAEIPLSPTQVINGSVVIKPSAVP